MARPRFPNELERVNLRLNKGSMETLRSIHPEVKPTVVIRALVTKYIRSIESKVAQPKLSSDEIISLGDE